MVIKLPDYQITLKLPVLIVLVIIKQLLLRKNLNYLALKFEYTFTWICLIVFHLLEQ